MLRTTSIFCVVMIGMVCLAGAFTVLSSGGSPFYSHNVTKMVTIPADCVPPGCRIGFEFNVTRPEVVTMTFQAPYPTWAHMFQVINGVLYLTAQGHPPSTNGTLWLSVYGHGALGTYEYLFSGANANPSSYNVLVTIQVGPLPYIVEHP